MTFDDATDVQAPADYANAMRDMLQTERYRDIDCIADAARAKKTKLRSGMWKLHVLYEGLERPRGHATEEDWQAHIALLKRWIAKEPTSITARVALATSYKDYGWDARGNGYAESITDSGWRLFQERVARAKEILEEAKSLKTKCPEWYLTMQEIALGEDWDRTKTKELFDEAVAFEPDYQYFYRVYANYLEPKWYGEPGESDAFLEQEADKIGGTAGDILYFNVANYLICASCRDDDQS